MGKGNPAHIKTEENCRFLEKMAGMGLTQKHAGYILGISEDTIQRHYKDEWARGKAKAHLKIASKLFDMAMSGNVACLTFWAKTQMGWREVQRIDATVGTEAEKTIVFSWLGEEEHAKSKEGSRERNKNTVSS